MFHGVVRYAIPAVAAATMAISSFGADAPPGRPKSGKTRVLEAGAKLLQPNAPVAAMDIYLNGFHPMKLHPEHRMEAHHFCRQVNEDFTQCVIFDGNGRDARLNGVEYIVSEKLFDTLPPEERRYWHPHNGEILSGQLVAPGIPAAAEKALMAQKMNSYGKTLHLWNTGTDGHGGDALPFGEPMLAWSFNRDGELPPDAIAQRDSRLGIHTDDKRQQRADLQPLAKPQSGVDDMKGAFGGNTRDIPGVVDRQAAPPPQ